MAISNFTNHTTSGVDEDALFSTTPGDQVRNFAKLTTTGDLADGIYVGADHAFVSNSGNIDTSGAGAAGVFVEGNDATIENRGSVVTHGDVYDPDPDVDGDEFFSEGLTALGDRFRVTNFGTVRVEGEESSGLSGVGADGVVTNSGRVEGAGHGSSLLAVFGDRSQAINTGQVIVTTDHNSGMLALGEDAAAINRGRIQMTGEGSVGMEGVITNTHLTNSNAIQVAGDGAIGMCALGDGHEISNLGTIDAGGVFAIGIEASGIADLDLAGLGAEIVNAGRITTSGDLAMGVTLGLTGADPSPGFTPAADGEIVNRSVIETKGDGAAGVAMIGDGHHLANSGRIAANGGVFDDASIGPFRAAGVVVSGDDAWIENARAGVISSGNAASAAVEFNVVERDGFSVADATSRLDNAGLITGPGVAVLGGAGEETVVNHGRIVGDVDLGGGGDTFVFGKGGSVTGAVRLGTGDDLVVIENGAGKASLADFTAGAASGDVVDVSDFFASFAALKAKSVQAGADVVITLDADDRLVLAGVNLNALNAGDFLFT